MFLAIMEHLNSVLPASGTDEKINEHEKALEEHDAFMATRQTLYCGGDQYFTELDALLETGTEPQIHRLPTYYGPAGCDY